MPVVYVLPLDIFKKLTGKNKASDAGIIRNKNGRADAIYIMMSESRVVIVPRRNSYIERRLKALYDAGVIKRVIVR